MVTLVSPLENFPTYMRGEEGRGGRRRRGEGEGGGGERAEEREKRWRRVERRGISYRNGLRGLKARV